MTRTPHFLASLALAGVLAAATSVSAGPVPSTGSAGPVQTTEEAIAADARWYARSQGVSQAEAVRRLRIQSEMGGLIGRLRRVHKARLAGIILEHQPVYQLRVRLTGTRPVPAEEHALGGSRLPVVFETGAKATIDELVTAITVHQAALGHLYPTLSGLGTDERTGEIVVYVYAPTADAADAAKAKFPQARAVLGQPARIEITSGYPTTM